MYLREKYRRPENAYPRTARATSGLRFLNPELGRWCSRDPAENEQTTDPYAFVRNGPTLYVDSLGLVATGFILEQRMKSLCPVDRCIAMDTAIYGIQCCCPQRCRSQAYLFATRLAAKVAVTFNAEMARHGDVVGGWLFGNPRRRNGKHWLEFGITPDGDTDGDGFEGDVDKDGRWCGEWMELSEESWREILYFWFADKKGCFPGMGLRKRGARESHIWAGIFGPEPGGVTANYLAADIHIDPWPNGGVTLIPSTIRTPNGIAVVGQGATLRRFAYGFK